MSKKNPDADPNCKKCGGHGANVEACGCGGNKPHHVCLPLDGDDFPQCLVTCICARKRSAS